VHEGGLLGRWRCTKSESKCSRQIWSHLDFMLSLILTLEYHDKRQNLGKRSLPEQVNTINDVIFIVSVYGTEYGVVKGAAVKVLEAMVPNTNVPTPYEGSEGHCILGSSVCSCRCCDEGLRWFRRYFLLRNYCRRPWRRVERIYPKVSVYSGANDISLMSC
jgi:hypothetical protein